MGLSSGEFSAQTDLCLAETLLPPLLFWMDERLKSVARSHAARYRESVLRSCVRGRRRMWGDRYSDLGSWVAAAEE